MERKLATFRKIADVRPIEGADAIELVVVDGWQCVTKKGEFKVGDPCIYFEIDSFLPVEPPYEFLRKSCFKTHPQLGEGFRIKTIKLRGELSQGLALPVSQVLPDVSGKVLLEEGEDLTDTLGVQKYEPPVSGAVLSGNARGNFPDFLIKSDQERIQNLFRIVERDYLDELFEVTMKLDGSSITVYAKREDNGEIRAGVCSRNLDLKIEDPSTFVDTTKRLGLLDAVSKFLEMNDSMEVFAIQGELMGPGIQKNRENFKDYEIFAYNVQVRKVGGRTQFLPPRDRVDVLCDVELICPGLHHVPVLEVSTLRDLDLNSVEKFLAFAEGTSINHPIREGVVFKQVNCVEPFQFKAISNKYLLKCEE